MSAHGSLEVLFWIGISNRKGQLLCRSSTSKKETGGSSYSYDFLRLRARTAYTWGEGRKRFCNPLAV